MTRTTLAALPLLAALLGCPTPPKPPHASEDPLLARACENLRLRGCPEGFDANGATCAQHLARRAELVEVPAACLADAATVEGVRACGGPGTLRVRCRTGS